MLRLSKHWLMHAQAQAQHWLMRAQAQAQHWFMHAQAQSQLQRKRLAAASSEAETEPEHA